MSDTKASPSTHLPDRRITRDTNRSGMCEMTNPISPCTLNSGGTRSGPHFSRAHSAREASEGRLGGVLQVQGGERRGAQILPRVRLAARPSLPVVHLAE